jgi:hypothetical protein
MMNLSDDDYDVLYEALREHLPRLTRSEFPAVLARVVDCGFVSITPTDEEILVRMRNAHRERVLPLQRKRTIH